MPSLTLRNHLNLYEVIIQFHGYYEVQNYDVQRQFVYFIAPIFIRKSCLKICTTTFTKDSHRIPKNLLVSL